MAKYWLLEKCPRLIYQFILIAIHGCLLFVTKVRFMKTADKMWHVACRILGQLHKRCEGLVVNPDKFKGLAGQLSKRPKHLSLILMNGCEKYIEELSTIAVWSFILGTSFITVYDKEGKICSSEGKLRKAIQNKLKQFNASEMKHYNCIAEECSSYEKGFVNSIQVISEKDCRQDIVAAAKKIAKQCELNEASTEDINSFLIDSELKATKGLPDPDLAIHFGKVQCLDGCLPWQHRLTEILSFGDLAYFNFQDFSFGFKKFSNCEQRLGK